MQLPQSVPLDNVAMPFFSVAASRNSPPGSMSCHFRAGKADSSPSKDIEPSLGAGKRFFMVPIVRFFSRKRRSVRKAIARGNLAREKQRWPDAALAYSAALQIDPTLAHIHIQHGHALKESGDRIGAEAAYRRALALNKMDADGWLQLGHVLKLLGRSAEAIEAYREALFIMPDFRPAWEEMIALGARSAIPQGTIDHAMRAVREPDSARSFRGLSNTVEQAVLLSALPAESYDEFRYTYPVPPPPETIAPHAPLAIVVRVDAFGHAPVEVRMTLESLLDQADGRWRAIVHADAALLEHPVASLTRTNPRISFTVEREREGNGPELLLRAGTILNPQAIAWFGYAADRIGGVAAYCDHDYAEENWRAPRRYFDPAFQPRFDPLWFGNEISPPVVIFRANGTETVPNPAEYGQALCKIAAQGGAIVHIPRVLATVLDVRSPVHSAPRDAFDEVARPVVDPSSRGAVEAQGANTISVVIPTRDHAGLLQRCVETLLAKAVHPDRLKIVIVDNRSSEPETAALLQRMAGDPRIAVQVFDEVFNWPRLNNVAIAQCDGALLVLLNNDTEMLTKGWDNIVEAYLGNPGIGIVGAKLLYPDRTVQHAGIIFGMNDGMPMHEGVGMAEHDPGPAGRWVRTRSVAAVTGAFMAMRRETWEAVEGFDEQAFPLGYNDVDMCLRVRAKGMRVAYAPDLLMIHYESKTRGHNVTRSQVAWDLAELRALYARWGERLFEDPTVNPHWSPRGRALFLTLREPSMRTVLSHLDRAGAP